MLGVGVTADGEIPPEGIARARALPGRVTGAHLLASGRPLEWDHHPGYFHNIVRVRLPGDAADPFDTVVELALEPAELRAEPSGEVRWQI